VTITAEERAKWRKESRANHMYLNQDGERLLLALDALASVDEFRAAAEVQASMAIAKRYPRDV